MLYEKNREKMLSDELFKNPTCEYRGTPFWAWNGKLDKETLLEQIGIMKKMGMGGFHMHVRTGMDSPYLNEEFMDFIKTCVEKAKEEDMLAWLYDEDRWPSGAAGGIVTRDKPEYAAKNLMITTRPYENGKKQENQGSVAGRGRGGMRQNNGELLAVYDVSLNSDGTLKTWKMIGEGDEAEGTKWYAYLEHGIADPWFNDAPYVDTLSDDAMKSFIETTHEAYKKAVGEDFGKTVPAIFTDEPQYNNKNTLSFAGEEKDLFLPWTADIEETFSREYGMDLLAGIPELLWELPEGKVSELRYDYHNHVADRFARAYCRQIGDWCRENGIALTGHVLGEEELRTQTQVLGEAMRCYRHFGIPGIDILCDRHEYTTAKQAQSIVHQMGAEAMLSELYGVTGWDCDFRTYKLQGDWQAALGVTVRVPHLFWMTMKGEAKRDYPASIGYQSPWYDQFSMIEDHFARLNTAMTRGVPAVRVAVVHPIESYWLHWGPSEQTAAVREHMEEQFHELAETLLFHGIDFDYISENELPHFCDRGGNPLQVGEMEYDVVIVCGCQTLRGTTLHRLKEFRAEGGELLFIGECPELVDAKPSGAVRDLYENSSRVSFSETAVLEALEPWRFLDIRREDGSREDRILHQMRKDGEYLWLFAATGKNPVCQDVDDAGYVRFLLKGSWKLTLYDTLTGEIRPVQASYQNGNTVLERRWYHHESMLLRLEPGCDQGSFADKSEAAGPEDLIFGTVPVELEEPNMLLLDIAEYALNGGEFMPEEEILRIDNLARQELGIPLRRKEVTQPYCIAPEAPRDTLTLRFRIFSEIAVEKPELALEDLDDTEIWLNLIPVKKQRTGWFVDQCIEKTALPPLEKGVNLLEVKVPVGTRTNLENFYLLGDFGVNINGTRKTIIPPVRRLGFGSITCQGLPFYTGNLLYKFRVRATGQLKIRIPRYRGGLLKVFVDGEDWGNVAFSPYQADLSGVEPGEHEIAIRLYGTRQNGFAQLHHTPGIWFYQSPNSYRSTGSRWCYEYQLKDAGILRSPEIYGGFVINEDQSTREAVLGSSFGIEDILLL